MARLRWVQAMLREWAAWIDGFGGVRSPDMSGLPRESFFGAHLPKDTFAIRRTQQAIDRLPLEHQQILMLVYVEGPRRNLVKLSEIARWQQVNERTFLDRVTNAESKFSQEIDFIRNFAEED